MGVRLLQIGKQIGGGEQLSTQSKQRAVEKGADDGIGMNGLCACERAQAIEQLQTCAACTGVGIEQRRQVAVGSAAAGGGTGETVGDEETFLPLHGGQRGIHLTGGRRGETEQQSTVCIGRDEVLVVVHGARKADERARQALLSGQEGAHSTMRPSEPMTVTCSGMDLPLAASADWTARIKPPQQGTSMRVTVMLAMSL